MDKKYSKVTAKAWKKRYLATEDGREISRASANRRARRRREWLNDLKAGKPCADCGGMFPTFCMDFDHRDRSEKFKNVSAMLMYSIDRIEQEIAKCDLVCANCHRMRTWSAC